MSHFKSTYNVSNPNNRSIPISDDDIQQIPDLTVQKSLYFLFPLHLYSQPALFVRNVYIIWWNVYKQDEEPLTSKDCLAVGDVKGWQNNRWNIICWKGEVGIFETYKNSATHSAWRERIKVVVNFQSWCISYNT